MIQDTVELNYNHLVGKLKVNDPDIGLISDNQSIGFMAHPSLAVSAQDGIPFGLSEIHLFERRIGQALKRERNYQSQPIEDKESYKWLLSAQGSKEQLSAASNLTIIGDRESDIYELFCRLPDDRTDLIIRSNFDRRLVKSGKRSKALSSLSWQDGLTVKVSGHKNRTKREAHLQFRWTSVELAKPDNSQRQGALKAYPNSVKLQVVEIKEASQSLPPGESPIHWILWTTHEVNYIEQAIQIGKWYANRWWIEDVFRVIKTKGFEVESSQLGSGQSLKKLVVLCLDQAWKILLMRQERTGQGQYPASRCFSEQECEILQAMQAKLEGATVKQKNPFVKDSLAWAVWLIARLGGWKPADMAKRPPGVITLARGLVRFNQQQEGWKMAMTILQQSSKFET